MHVPTSSYWRKSWRKIMPKCVKNFLLVKFSFCFYTVKKRIASFPSPAGFVTTKLSLGGNNDVITELFLPRGSLVSERHPGWRREIREPFFTVYVLFILCFFYPTALHSLWLNIILSDCEVDMRICTSYCTRTEIILLLAEKQGSRKGTVAPD
jgi:hypothetical protein